MSFSEENIKKNNERKLPITFLVVVLFIFIIFIYLIERFVFHKINLKSNILKNIFNEMLNSIVLGNEKKCMLNTIEYNTFIPLIYFTILIATAKCDNLT